MVENDLTNAGKMKSVLTAKNVLRVLSLLCIIFVFCPSFLVSCSGQNVNVSVMTAVGGVSVYGEKVVDPHPIMLVSLLLPIAILVLLFLKKFTDTRTATIILGCAVIDFVIWLIFRSSVKKVADEAYCEFKTTGWFFINIIVLLLIIILCILIAMRKVQMEADLRTVFSGGNTKDAIGQMSATVNQVSNSVTQFAGSVVSNINKKPRKEDVIGYCSKCGKPIIYGSKFCTSCGTQVPESMIAEAEAAKKAAEEQARLAAEEARRKEEERMAAEAARAERSPQNNGARVRFCQACGARLSEDAAFCESCGTKVER